MGREIFYLLTCALSDRLWRYTYTSVPKPSTLAILMSPLESHVSNMRACGTKAGASAQKSMLF